MTIQVTAVITAIKTLDLLIGGLITFYSYRAYQRTESSSLLALTIGFGIITFGALIAGIIDQVLMLSEESALIVEESFTTIGFGVILYSLYM